MNNFTNEDMIRFLYNEMTTEETQLFIQALEADWTFKERFEVLKQSKASLDNVSHAPRTSTINAIMQYAEITETVSH